MYLKYFLVLTSLSFKILLCCVIWGATSFVFSSPNEGRLNFKRAPVIEKDSIICTWMIEWAVRAEEWGQQGEAVGGRRSREVEEKLRSHGSSAMKEQHAGQGQATEMVLPTSPDIESRTGLICNYSMASEDASSQYSLPEPLITVRLGSYTVPT